MSLEDFERSCRDTSRQLRRLPSELRKAIAADAQTRVADPVVADLRGRWAGPWARQLAAGTKSRKAADPTLVIGGARRVVSGGASVRQLVYGAEWGGGKRVTPTRRTTRNGGRATAYRLRSTRQFLRPTPALVPTLRDNAGRMLTAWAELVLDTFDKVVDRGR